MTSIPESISVGKVLTTGAKMARIDHIAKKKDATEAARLEVLSIHHIKITKRIDAPIKTKTINCVNRFLRSWKEM